MADRGRHTLFSLTALFLAMLCFWAIPSANQVKSFTGLTFDNGFFQLICMVAILIFNTMSDRLRDKRQAENSKVSFSLRILGYLPAAILFMSVPIGMYFYFKNSSENFTLLSLRGMWLISIFVGYLLALFINMISAKPAPQQNNT